MSSISNITSACRGLIDQMNKSSQGWHDGVQQSFYSRRLYPLIEKTADYQAEVCKFMQSLDDYKRRIAAIVGVEPAVTGFGEHELFRDQTDYMIFEQMKNKQY